MTTSMWRNRQRTRSRSRDNPSILGEWESAGEWRRGATAFLCLQLPPPSTTSASEFNIKEMYRTTSEQSPPKFTSHQLAPKTQSEIPANQSSTETLQASAYMPCIHIEDLLAELGWTPARTDKWFKGENLPTTAFPLRNMQVHPAPEPKFDLNSEYQPTIFPAAAYLVDVAEQRISNNSTRQCMQCVIMIGEDAILVGVYASVVCSETMPTSVLIFKWSLYQYSTIHLLKVFRGEDECKTYHCIGVGLEKNHQSLYSPPFQRQLHGHLQVMPQFTMGLNKTKQIAEAVVGEYDTPAQNVGLRNTMWSHGQSIEGYTLT
ncbi:hypothetical protein B0H21DRAFT_713023 [Amylocystis lapponica]|nr:hypothetical protein B0H21DRAFT_713023 [Amylocystis lapponica]